MNLKRAILTGERQDLQAFIYEWYDDEAGGVPILEEGMDVVLNVSEKHERPLKSMAHAFHLHCFILD